MLPMQLHYLTGPSYPYFNSLIQRNIPHEVFLVKFSRLQKRKGTFAICTAKNFEEASASEKAIKDTCVVRIIACAKKDYKVI